MDDRFVDREVKDKSKGVTRPVFVSGRREGKTFSVKQPIRPPVLRSQNG